MSKIYDGMIGFIIGDAMGVPVEFCTREELFEKPITDMIGYGSHHVPAGAWSDDTSMTLALIDSINNKENIDYNDIMQNFIDWINNSKYTPEGNVFDIGRTCLRAIKNYHGNINPCDCGLNDLNSNGNGSLMRILPLAYYIYYKNITDEEEIINLVNNISSLTHAHNISKMGCYIYIKYVLNLLNGFDKFKSYEMIKCINYDFYDEDTKKIYSRVLDHDISKYDINDIKSSGYVVDTLEAALWVLLNTDNYKQAIIGAINLGGDTDTIGAICGSMAGIIYGINDIPSKWINSLLRKEYLYNLLDKFENILCNKKNKRD